MKSKDFLGIFYFFAITTFFIFKMDWIIGLTKIHPYFMSFAKFAFLATFGECLNNRITNTKWIPSKIYLRFFIWGLMGIFIFLGFSMSEEGIIGIVNKNLCPANFPNIFKSLWMHFGGFAFILMSYHRWADIMIEKGLCWPWKILTYQGMERWAKITILSIVFFWTPISVFTLSLSSEWRMIAAAYLAIMFGIIQAFASKRK